MPLIWVKFISPPKNLPNLSTDGQENTTFEAKNTNPHALIPKPVNAIPHPKGIDISIPSIPSPKQQSARQAIYANIFSTTHPSSVGLPQATPQHRRSRPNGFRRSVEAWADDVSPSPIQSPPRTPLPNFVSFKLNVLVFKLNVMVL